MSASKSTSLHNTRRSLKVIVDQKFSKVSMFSYLRAVCDDILVVITRQP